MVDLKEELLKKEFKGFNEHEKNVKVLNLEVVDKDIMF